MMNLFQSAREGLIAYFVNNKCLKMLNAKYSAHMLMFTHHLLSHKSYNLICHTSFVHNQKIKPASWLLK